MYLFKMVYGVARKDEGIPVLWKKMRLDVQANSFTSILSPACMGLDFSWIIYKDKLSNYVHKLEGTCMIAINSYMMLFVGITCTYVLFIFAT